MRKLFWFLILTLAQRVGAQAPADLINSGLQFDDKAYLRIERKPDNVLYKAPLPRSLSYEKYLPTIERQGDYGTCVAFSCAYYTRTMIEAIQHGLTTKAHINQTRFSPTYLYARMKQPGDVTCQQGGTLDEGLSILKNYGTPFWSSLSYPQCIGTVKSYDAQAAPFRIRHFERVFDFVTMSQKIRRGSLDLESVIQSNVLNIKQALAGGYPVPIGMMIPLSFQAVSTDTWVPGPSDTDDLFEEIKSGFKRRKLFGHALTVIGYDDKRQAFRVVNSWGTRWADNGLCWIKYHDFALFTRYAFRVYPMDLPPVRTVKLVGTETSIAKSSSVNFSKPTATMRARVELQLLDGAQMPARRLLSQRAIPGKETNNGIGLYHLVRAYPSGTRFKLIVNNEKAAYVYVVGTDQSLTLTRLFPPTDSLSAMVAANESAVLPGPNQHVRLDNNPGLDYYLILFSDKPLDLRELSSKMSKVSGDLVQKINQTLGSKLVDGRSMTYALEEIKFNTAFDYDPTSKVVPLLISLTHKP